MPGTPGGHAVVFTGAPRSPARNTDRRVPDSTDTAGGLVAALAAVPAGDPSRPARRTAAIEAWLPMANRLASRYSGRGVPTDDLRQIATIGLIKAVDKFDPARGTDFVGYAIPTILGEMKRWFRDRTWLVQVPRRLQELRLAITAADAVLAHELHRSPTVADVAAHLGLSEEEVLEGLEGARAYHAVSLSAPLDSGHDGTLGDTLGEEDQEYAAVEARVALRPALAGLDERERRILTLRFYGNLTQSDIARQLGISQMHVSRLIARALLKLRHHLETDGF